MWSVYIQVLTYTVHMTRACGTMEGAHYCNLKVVAFGSESCYEQKEHIGHISHNHTQDQILFRCTSYTIPYIQLQFDI